MGTLDILLLLLIGAVLALAVRRILLNKRQGKSCSGCCEGCSGCDAGKKPQ